MKRSRDFMKRWWDQTSAVTQRFNAAHKELQLIRDQVCEDTELGQSCRAAADELLGDARVCADAGNLLQAWSLLQHAERSLVPMLSDEMVAARLCSVQREAAEKLTGWRCAAAKDLGCLEVKPVHLVPSLTTPVGVPSTPGEAGLAARSRLQELMRLINESAQNTYLKQHMVRVQVWTLVGMWAVFVILALLGVGLRNGCWPTWSPGISLCLPHANYARGLQIGIFGSLLSMSFNFVQPARSQKVPAVSADWIVMWMRLFVGGASAVAVVLLLHSNIFKIPSVEPTTLTVFTFLAGFSERWFKDAIEEFVSQRQRAV